MLLAESYLWQKTAAQQGDIAVACLGVVPQSLGEGVCPRENGVGKKAKRLEFGPSADVGLRGQDGQPGASVAREGFDSFT